MKRILIAGAFALAAGGQALAADFPPPPAPMPQVPATYVPVAAAPIYTWSGVYIGVNGGYGFGTTNWNDPLFGVSTGNFNTGGFLIGGTLGANIQWGPVVVGIEGDADWTNLNGTNTSICFPPGCETASNFLGTVRGRVGYAFDRILVYGTAGGAFGNVQVGPPLLSNTQVGWTAGAGVEFAIAPAWTAKAEYLYVDLGNVSCTSIVSCFGDTTITFTENIVRAGVNYKFSW